MENTSDSFMPRPLLFCLKSGRSVCYSVPDNTIGKIVVQKRTGLEFYLKNGRHITIPIKEET